MPYRPSRFAVIRPVGPAPITTTSASTCGGSRSVDTVILVQYLLRSGSLTAHSARRLLHHVNRRSGVVAEAEQYAEPRAAIETADEPKPRDGNQTLARGLRVFLAIVDADHGMTVQQVGRAPGRAPLDRLPAAADPRRLRLVARDPRRRVPAGARLATLADAYLPALRDVAAPVMRALADRLESTISLFVEQGDEAVAISIVEPTTATHHIAFKPGMRTTMDQRRGRLRDARVAAPRSRVSPRR